jgi:hypothetical protein
MTVKIRKRDRDAALRQIMREVQNQMESFERANGRLARSLVELNAGRIFRKAGHRQRGKSAEAGGNS